MNKKQKIYFPSLSRGNCNTPQSYYLKKYKTASKNLKKSNELSHIYLEKFQNRELYSSETREASFALSEAKSVKSATSSPLNFYEKRISTIITSMNGKIKRLKSKASLSNIKVEELDLYKGVKEAYKKFRLQRYKRQEHYRQFIEALSAINPLFLKLDYQISFSFLKMGKILTFKSSEFIYFENDPIQALLIILWGQVKLTFSQKSQKYLRPGQFLGQQFILYDSLPSLERNKVFLPKGIQPHSENASCTKDSGLLRINREQYNFLECSMCKMGLKMKFYLGEKLMKWCYGSKKKFSN